MSKTYRKFDGSKDSSSCKKARTYANRIVRRHLQKMDEDEAIPLSSGRSYKKVSDSWDITDWKRFYSPAEQSHNYHNPLKSSFHHPCDPGNYLRGFGTWRWVDLPPVEYLPQVFNVDTYRWEYVLPAGGFFPEHLHRRLNPLTGKIEEYGQVYDSSHYFAFLKPKFGWKPYVVSRKYALPVDCFLDNCEKYVEEREKDTRNYRLRHRYPKGYRRIRQEREKLRNMGPDVEVDATP